MNRISCEICGSADLIKQDGVFVCQACGCKYSAEEIKKQLVEVVGSVQVEGVENADALYSKALDWLNLNNSNKAIETLEDMVNKYPGDKRGWQKLARLKPTRETIDNAIRLGDYELLEEWRTAAENACEDVRNGRGDKWIERNPSSGRGDDFVLEQDDRYRLFQCVEELIDEGRKNAQYFNDSYNQLFCSDRKEKNLNILNPHYWAAALNILWRDEGYGIIIPIKDVDKAGARIIVENIVVFARSGAKTCKKVINKAIIQQTFQEIENLLANYLCPYCRKKRSILRGNRCTSCKKDVPWFHS